jgi:hypothetical protein
MSRFERAVRREMRTIVKERAGRPSHLMDYGEDWPPKPAPPVVRRPRLPLWQKCVAAVVGYALVWALGEVVLQIAQVARH